MTFANEYLSYSRLKRFAQCPKSYELHYVRKEPALPSPATQFGSALHLALEQTYRAIQAERIAGRFPEDRLAAAFRAAWAESGLGDFALFREGLAILSAYAREHALVDPAQVLAVEQEFRLPVGRFEVLGYIDRVDRTDDETVTVVDYKSNRVVFTRDEVATDLQLSIYALAARQLWPWAKRVRLGFYLLRHGLWMETTRSEADLAAARQYVELLGAQTEAATEFPARLNEFCAYCDHRAQCPAYHRALLGRVEAVCADEADLAAVARERDEVARTAKILYARKDALERILRARLEEVERLELGGTAYTLAKVAQLTYPTAPTLAVFRELLGKSDDELTPLLLSVDKSKVEALVRDLARALPAADVRLLRARLEAVADKSFSPRFVAQRVAGGGGAP